MAKRSKSKKPLVVGDWVHIIIAGMGNDNYQIESIDEDTYTCILTEGTYKHKMIVSENRLKRL